MFILLQFRVLPAIFLDAAQPFDQRPPSGSQWCIIVLQLRGEDYEYYKNVMHTGSQSVT